jgi:predicted adenylyl cyclase CyaB
MPSNIEIKARISDIEVVRRKVEKLDIKESEEIFQEDTFFKTDIGRLKLRIFSQEKGELIYYLRNDSTGPKRSDYKIYKTNDPISLKKILETSLGIRGVIKKNRSLYIVGHTRIHLDKVENLGTFLELEVVLSAEQNENEGISIANDFLKKLGIDKKDLVDKAYIDLLETST